MIYKYTPEGVCSMQMTFQIENNIVRSLKIEGGCPGNTVGVSRLVEGKRYILSRPSSFSIGKI